MRFSAYLKYHSFGLSSGCDDSIPLIDLSLSLILVNSGTRDLLFDRVSFTLADADGLCTLVSYHIDSERVISKPDTISVVDLNLKLDSKTKLMKGTLRSFINDLGQYISFSKIIYDFDFIDNKLSHRQSYLNDEVVLK